MNAIMLDIETLGKGPNAVIVAIGAVAFDETGLGSTFYLNIKPQSCVDLGMQMDADTVMWWMQQSEAARKALAKGGVGITEALQAFSVYVEEQGPDVEVWGNGATFDNVILASAYRLAGIERPWSYKGDRCYRTLRALFPQIKAADTGGTAHNALDDAKYQALHASQILAAIHKMGVEA